MLIDEVSAIIREVGAAEVVPRFRALANGEIMEKSPGDFVTIADQECERVLAERLRAVRDIPVVGEEATAADSTLLDLVAGAEAVWVVDPIDGTSNFVAGNTNYVVMIALVEQGETIAAWIWHPDTDIMLTAEAGRGVCSDGVPVVAPGRGVVPKGILKGTYMPEPARTRLKAQLEKSPESVGSLVRPFRSAGIEYRALVDGRIDYLMYWRTLPWDHAPGALIASEAGLRVSRLDGSSYQPGDGRVGLLAATAAVWDQVAAEINLALADD